MLFQKRRAISGQSLEKTNGGSARGSLYGSARGDGPTDFWGQAGSGGLGKFPNNCTQLKSVFAHAHNLLVSTTKMNIFVSHPVGCHWQQPDQQQPDHWVWTWHCGGQAEGWVHERCDHNWEACCYPCSHSMYLKLLNVYKTSQCIELNNKIFVLHPFCWESCFLVRWCKC